MRLDRNFLFLYRIINVWFIKFWWKWDKKFYDLLKLFKPTVTFHKGAVHKGRPQKTEILTPPPPSVHNFHRKFFFSKTLRKCWTSFMQGERTCGEIRWNPVKSGEIRWNTVKYGEIRWNTVKYGEIRWNTVKSGEIRWNTVKYGEIRWNTVKYGEKR